MISEYMLLHAVQTFLTEVSILFLSGAQASLNMTFIVLICRAHAFYSFCQHGTNHSDSGFCTFCFVFSLSGANTILPEALVINLSNEHAIMRDKVFCIYFTEMSG